jgi:hypothetical protein
MRTCQTGTNKGSSASQEEVLPDSNGRSFIKQIETREKSPTVIDGSENMVYHVENVPTFT